MAAARRNDRGFGMKKRIIIFMFFAALSAFGQSGLYNPVSKKDLQRLGVGMAGNSALSDVNGNVSIGSGAGGVNGYEDLGEAICDPYLGSCLVFGASAARSAAMNESVILGANAGLGAGWGYLSEWSERPAGNLFVGTGAGRGSQVTSSTLIGKGAGWGSSGSFLLILNQFTSDEEAMTSTQTDSPFYFDASDGRLLLGRPSGTLDVRGANIASAFIITGLVQEVSGSGYVTNIILQGMNGKVIQ